MSIIEVNCSQENCPSFKNCSFIPTTVFPIDQKVDIIFIENDFNENSNRLIKSCILEAKKIWGKPFGVALSYYLRNNMSDDYKFCHKFLIRDINRLKKVYDLKVVMPVGDDITRTIKECHQGITIDNENIFTINNETFGSIIVKTSISTDISQIVENILESLRRINL